MLRSNRDLFRSRDVTVWIQMYSDLSQNGQTYLFVPFSFHWLLFFVCYFLIFTFSGRDWIKGNSFNILFSFSTWNNWSSSPHANYYFTNISRLFFGLFWSSFCFPFPRDIHLKQNKNTLNFNKKLKSISAKITVTIYYELLWVVTPTDARPVNRSVTLNSIHKNHNNPSDKVVHSLLIKIQVSTKASNTKDNKLYHFSPATSQHQNLYIPLIIFTSLTFL